MKLFTLTFTIAIFITTACLQPVFAQQSTIDSVEKIIPTLKDSSLAASYNELTWQYRTINRDKAILYGKKAIELSKQIKYSKGEAQAYNDLGILFMDDQAYDTALYYYNLAIPLRQQMHDTKGLAALYLKIGILYQKWGKYDNALENGQQSLKLFKELNDANGIATALNNIGIISHNMNHDKQALKYYDESIIISKKSGNNRMLATAYLNMGNSYFTLKDYTSAITFFTLADSLGHEIKSNEIISTATQNLAGIFTEIGEYKKGLNYVSEAYNIRQQMDDKKAMVSSLNTWGRLLGKSGDKNNAIKKLQEGIALANVISGCNVEKIELYNNLTDVYTALGDYKNALAMSKLSIALKDSIFNSDVSARFSQLETQYQTAKKEQKIQEQRFEITKRNYMIGAAIALLIVGTMLGYSYYRRYTLKKERELQQAIITQQDIASKAIIEAEERERKRIATDLHDGIGQLFSAVRMNMSNIAHHIQFENSQTESSFQKTLELVDESCKEVRTISHQMMPNTLLKYGLASAIRDFISKIDTSKLSVNFDSYGLNERLDANTETILYRVLQEVVNNVIKHANANKLDIQISKDDDSITTTIEDNGKGFDTRAANQKDGIGLKNIRSRVEYLKGSVEFDSQINKGTVVIIWIPFDAKTA